MKVYFSTFYKQTTPAITLPLPQPNSLLMQNFIFFSPVLIGATNLLKKIKPQTFY
jgi:hypothetical protein